MGIMINIKTSRKLPEKLKSFKEMFPYSICLGIKIWRCPECSGNGKLYDPEDHDDREGYKLAHRKITCTRCSGTGCVSEKSLRQKEYKEEVERHKKRVLEYKKFVKLISSAEKKLTEKEIDAINNANPYFNY